MRRVNLPYLEKHLRNGFREVVIRQVRPGPATINTRSVVTIPFITKIDPTRKQKPGEKRIGRLLIWDCLRAADEFVAQELYGQKGDKSRYRDLGEITSSTFDDARNHSTHLDNLMWNQENVLKIGWAFDPIDAFDITLSNVIRVLRPTIAEAVGILSQIEISPNLFLAYQGWLKMYSNVGMDGLGVQPKENETNLRKIDEDYTLPIQQSYER